MFSYFGRKKRLAKYYQKPLYDTIIEPFAGSAAYSLHDNNYEKQIILTDLDIRVFNIWKYLIEASYADIMSLPILKEGESLKNISQLTDSERVFLSYNMNSRGSHSSKYVLQKANSWNEAYRKKAAENVEKIKHWKIIQCSYGLLDNICATWFIDPPYQVQGKIYRHSDIDFKHLSVWCKSRLGQVIVCEQYGKADWLPFKPLTKNKGGYNLVITEGVWYNIGV